MTSGRVSIVKNITWLTGASLLVKPAWLFFIVVLCWRHLGTAGFGVFSTALWLAFIPASMTDLGLTQLTIRDVARARSSASEYFSNLIVFKLFAGPLACVIAIGAGLALGYENEMLWAVVGAGVYAVSLQTMEYLRAFYRAFENLRLEGLSTILEKVLVISVGLTALLTTESPEGTLGGIAAGLFIAVVLNVGWISANLAKLDLSLVTVRFIRGAITNAIPLFLYSFSIVAYIRLGGVLLEFWHGEEVAGEFAAAFRIVEALMLLPAVFAAALLPRLSTLYHEKEFSLFQSVVWKSMAVAVGMAVAIALGVSLLSDFIMVVANPNETSGAPARVLSALAWLFPLTTAKHLLIVALVASDRHLFLAKALGGALLISCALHLGLTYAFASLGLAGVLAVVDTLVIAACALRLFSSIKQRTHAHPPTDVSEGREPDLASLPTETAD